MTESSTKCLISILILLVAILLCCHSSGIPLYCPCEEQNLCQPVPNGVHLKHEGKEVYVMSDDYNDSRKTWQHWDWSSISNVISEGDPDPTLMCYTHLNGRRYGYTGQLTEELLKEETLTKSWIVNETKQVMEFYIDIYLLDLLQTLTLGMTAENITEITNVISDLKSQLVSVSANISFLCLINWFPPCYESQCNFITKMISVCDKFMLSSESFLSIENTHCMAQATVPFTKLHLGFDEFMANEVSPQKFILSVPWHGYVYDCNIFKPKGNGSLYDQCFIKKKNESEICDYENYRVRIDMNTLAKKYTNFEADNTWNSVYLAPYFNIKRVVCFVAIDTVTAVESYLNSTTMYQWMPRSHANQRTGILMTMFDCGVVITQEAHQLHFNPDEDETTGDIKQIWFEDYRSLRYKYEYIREMNVSGIAIWSGNDLHYSSLKWYDGFNKVMWGWLVHQVLMQPKPQDKTTENLKSLPKTMAGIGIGCVLIGGILGFIFGWGVFRRTHKRNRRQPFEKDMVYMEEDLNL